MAFCILLFIITLTVHACSYVFSFVWFLCIVTRGGVCPGARAAAKGPGSQPKSESAVRGSYTASLSIWLRDGG